MKHIITYNRIPIYVEELHNLFPKFTDRVGGGITPAVLSHHRAYGSVPRRFLSVLTIVNTWVCFVHRVAALSFRTPQTPPRFPTLLVYLSRSNDSSLPCVPITREHAWLAARDRFSPSCYRFHSTTTASADFWYSIPTPRDVSSSIAEYQTSRGNSRDLPAYACRLYVAAFRASIGL